MQAAGVFLQGQQGVLALFVTTDVVVQVARLQVQPGAALAGVLVGQRRVQRVRFEAGQQRVLLVAQLFLLVQVFLDLAVDATQLSAQFIELFLQLVDHLLRVGLFVLVVAAEALQQGFGLMIRVLLATAHGAGLVILQLRAQLFDALAAGQALAFEQLAGHIQRLLGGGQLVLAIEAFADQLLALLQGRLLAFAQGLQAQFEVLLVAPQPAQFFDLALLLAVFLQQLAEQADLFGQGLGFCLGFAVEQGQGGALLLKLGTGLTGALLQAGQLGTALVEAVAQLHQLLQAVAIGTPGFTQPGQRRALCELFADLLQALFVQALLFIEAQQLVLAFGTGLIGLLLERRAMGQFLLQAGQGVLLGKGLAHQRRAFGLLCQGLGEGCVGLAQVVLQLLLVAMQQVMLLALRGYALGQRAELGIERLLAGKLVTLRRQLFQTREFQPLAVQAVVVLLGTVQLRRAGLHLFLQLQQLGEPAALLFKLAQLRLFGLEPIEGPAVALV
ncbi:hypothetical protein D9M71_336520 [compost metagenome]